MTEHPSRVKRSGASEKTGRGLSPWALGPLMRSEVIPKKWAPCCNPQERDNLWKTIFAFFVQGLARPTNGAYCIDMSNTDTRFTDAVLLRRIDATIRNASHSAYLACRAAHAAIEAKDSRALDVAIQRLQGLEPGWGCYV